MPSLSNEDETQQETHDRIGDAQVEWLRTQPHSTGDVSRGQRRTGHRQVPRTLIEPHRQSPAHRPHEVDLHDDRGRPRESLTHPEQHVGRQYPVPGRAPHEQQRHRYGNAPAHDKYDLASISIGQPPGEVVRDGFHESKNNNEGKDRRLGRKMKLALCQTRKKGPFKAHHPTYERVHKHE